MLGLHLQTVEPGCQVPCIHMPKTPDCTEAHLLRSALDFKQCATPH